MERNFVCPHCSSYLNVAGHIIFSVRKADKQRGLVLLSPHIGNYSSEKNKNFPLKKGEPVEFFCPVCHKSLVSDIDENLVQVVMTEPDGREFNIYFSRISGEQSTYQVSDDEYFEAGRDAGKYTYFKLSDQYKPLVKRKNILRKKR